MAPFALLSVSDKSGLVPFAKTLHEKYGYQLLSSGGTAKVLEGAGLSVIRVSDHTKFPEILGGRVKTLHPRIHGGILAKRKDPSHEDDLKQQDILPIEIVVVNLYPFKKTIEKASATWDESIENIDIGGPAMVRAAAKNHSDVSVLTNPRQYTEFLDALSQGNGVTTQEIRSKLALQAFEHTAAYDIAISKWIGSQIEVDVSSPWLSALPLKQRLRYGENPHQKAAWYSNQNAGWGSAKQLQGKELSTNNLLDLDAAICSLREFGYGESGSTPARHFAAVVVKHTNPCGVATGDELSEAFNKALDGDRISAFGGIVALNKIVDSCTAENLASLFIECVVAPGFSSEARAILSKKKNLRLLELPPEAIDSASSSHVRSILGGALVQELDNGAPNTHSWRVVTEKIPTKDQEEDMDFAWRVIRHVHSNAILVAKNMQTFGIGAGQMNRVGAAKLALEAAGENAKDSVLASDGFFPFDDTVRLAAKYGVNAIIQPGGSIKDEDSINACNEFGITMVLTGMRHFLH